MTGRRAAWWSVLLALPVLLGAEGEPHPASSCVVCHGLLDEGLAHSWELDVHRQAGLGCESCHGGDPAPALAEDADTAMAPARGFQPAPDRLHIPDFCAGCHADATFMRRYDPQGRVDQLAEYRTSLHGRLNAQGDSAPATCVDCHGTHGIRQVASPESPVYATNVPRTCARCHADAALMARYGIPTDQYASYLESMHASALLERGDTAAPACNDCHGNHGAAPPGVDSVAFVCGHCHGREATLFRSSFKKDVFESLGQAECIVCHDHHRIRHATPELFHGGSAPQLSQGSVLETQPFSADLGSLESGRTASASWRAALRPHLHAGDERLAHRVEVSSDGAAPLVLDATVRPGDGPDVQEPRRGGSGPLAATLSLEPLSGSPVEAGDAILFTLELRAVGPGAVRTVRVRDLPGEGLDPLAGSACLNCHSPGDSCDQATERMYAALNSLERDMRQAAAILREAEVAGMEVSGALFDLKSKGVTAAVEARALIHAFDPERLIRRTEEGAQVAAEARQAGTAALAELEFRRKGLAVSLVLVALVLAALYLKIRELDRSRRDVPTGEKR